jgi:D-alanine-D-alanine ligase-like ATP-grasp enzyme
MGSGVSCLQRGQILDIFSKYTRALGCSKLLTGDKHLTKSVLSRSGIPVPVGAAFAEQSAALKYFLSRKCPQVVKPLDSFGGRGVTVGVHDKKTFFASWKNARAHANRIIIEDFFEGDEVRISVLGGRIVAAMCRVPAFVVGDGASSISQLVFEKNKIRNNNPRLRMSPITSFDQIRLDGRSLDEVPAENEYVRLSTTSYSSLGGENVAVLGHLHPSIIETAEKVYHAIPGATLLGLDVLIKDFSAEATHQNVCVLEVNANPAITTPVFAAYGPPFSNVPNDLLDFVASGHYETARRADWNGKPVISPAPIYNARCGGNRSGEDIQPKYACSGRRHMRETCWWMPWTTNSP